MGTDALQPHPLAGIVGAMPNPPQTAERAVVVGGTHRDVDIGERGPS